MAKFAALHLVKTKRSERKLKVIKKTKKPASLSDVRDKLSVSCSMNSKLKAGSLGAYLLMCRLSAGPLKGLMVHADTGGKSMYGPPW